MSVLRDDLFPSREARQRDRAEALEHFSGSQMTAEPKDQSTKLSRPEDAANDSRGIKHTGPEWLKLHVEQQHLQCAISRFNKKGQNNKVSGSVNALKDCHDFEALVIVLDEQRNTWLKNRWLNGKPQDFFNRICKGLDGHETILSAFPDSSIYVSVFCAALKTVIKVSQNYQAIAESIAKNVEIISDVVHSAKDRVIIWREKHILDKFANLYSAVFLFFTLSLDWYRDGWRGWGHRLKNSLNNSYYDRHFSSCVENIRVLGSSIQDKAEVYNQASVIDTYQDVQSVKAELRDIKVAFAKIAGTVGAERKEAERRVQELLADQEQRNYSRQTQLQLQEGSRNKLNQRLEMLFGADFDLSHRANILQKLASQEVDRAQTLLVPNGRASGDASIYKKEILISHIESLEGSIHEKDYNNSILTSYDKISISAATSHSLQFWFSSPLPAALWLSMPYSVEASIDSANTAAGIIKAISSAPDPAEPQMLFHFCRIPAYDTPVKDINRHEAGAISLLYSLIVQLIHGLPPAITSSKDLSETRFQKLEGSMRSWADAISLFEDLVSLSMPYTFCVIDAFGLLDYADGMQPCRELILALRRVMALCDSQQRVFKILFTTAGKTTTLSSLLQKSEVHYERETARRRQKYRGGLGKPRTADVFARSGEKKDG